MYVVVVFELLVNSFAVDTMVASSGDFVWRLVTVRTLIHAEVCKLFHI